MIRGFIRFFAAFLVLAPVACGTPALGSLHYSEVSVAPLEPTLGDRNIQIAEGITVKAHVTAIDDSGSGYDSAPELSSNDRTILRVDTVGSGNFVFTGVSVGQTTIEVFVAGDHVGRVSAEVVAQSTGAGG